MNKKKLIALIGVVAAGTIGIIGLTSGNKDLDENEIGRTALLYGAPIKSFNEQFQKYQGDAVNGTNVRALINSVNSSNANEYDMRGNRYIQMLGETSLKDIHPTSKYEVMMEDNGMSKMLEYNKIIVSGEPDGYIDTIKITEKKDK